MATPTNQHHKDIADCIIANKPCLVEKPISTMTPINTSSVLMVGYNLRFHSCVKKAKEWLMAGDIGKPLWARFTCAQHNDKPDYLRDGVILNWSHEIDLALFLLGDAKVVASSSNAQESLADIILYHTIGCHTVVHLDYLTPWERRGFVIVGTDGAIEVDLLTRQAFLRDNKGSFPGLFYGRDTYDGNYLAEARTFLARLAGKITEGCTAEEGMKVVKICLEAKEYARV